MTAPVELFGHTWDAVDTPIGAELAALHTAAHALDLDHEETVTP